MSYVLSPLTLKELEEFFDDTSLEVIHYFLKKSIISQPEKLPNQEDIPIQIPKEHIEQWIVQALGTKSSGAGSYPVDVVTKEWGADVKMLSCKLTDKGELKNADSGETSLAQKFGDGNFGDGTTLDQLFAEKKYELIWSKWQDILKAKYKQVEHDHNITDIYYFIVLRAGPDFHLCGLKVDLSKLEDTTVNWTRSTNDSIWIKEFIQDQFGHVKIYKAKKRFELRLKPKYWVDNNRVLTFNTNFKQLTATIKDKILDNTLEDYIDEVIVPILKSKDDNE